MFNVLEMTSKTKLLPQVENGEKITFLDFMVPRAILLETNAPFCSDNCDKLVSNWHKVGLEIGKTSIQSICHRNR